MISAEFNIFTLPIIQLVHLPPPPPPSPPSSRKKRITLLGSAVVPREIQDKAYAKLWGMNKMHYGQ